jgi:hypothetical protein
VFRQPFNNGKTAPYDKLQHHNNIDPHIYHHSKIVNFISTIIINKYFKYMIGTNQIYIH